MRLRQTISFFLLAALAWTLIVPANVFAAGLTARKDVMSRDEASALSNHEIRFTTPTGVDAPADTIVITLPSGFALGAVAFGDIDLFHGPATGFETNETLAAAPGAGVWGVSVAGQNITLTAPTNAGVGEIAAGDKVVIRIGTNASGGVNQITNPSSAGVRSISISGTFGDAGGISVSISANDSLAVSLTVPSAGTGLTGGGSGGGGPGTDGTPPSVSGIQIRNITPTSAEIVWTTDEAATSFVDYGLTASYGSGTVSNAAFVMSHSIVLSGLSPDTTYHFRIRTADAANNLTTTPDATFRTTIPSRAPIISNLRASSITDSSAIILWDTDMPATSRVEYGLTASYGLSVASPTLIASHTLSLSGLSAGTSYHYRAISTEAGGLSVTSSDAIFSTTPDTTAPANVFGFSATPDVQRVAFSWTNPADADFDHIVIVARTDRAPMGMADGRVVYSGAGTSFTDSGLSGGTRVYYGAFAVDHSGNPSSGSFLESTPQGVVVVLPPPPLPIIIPPPEVITPTPTVTSGGTGTGGTGNGGTGTGGTVTTTTTSTLPIFPLPSATTTEIIPPPVITLPLPSIPATTTTPATTPAPTAQTHYYFAGSQVELEQDANGTFTLIPNRAVLLRVAVAGLPSAIVSGSVSVGGSTYGLARSSDGLSYEAMFVPGIRTGEEPIIATIELVNGQRIITKQTSRLIGSGRVREAAVFGNGQGVVGASVLLNEIINGKERRWDPVGTNQRNPVLTAADGSYGFVVPNGRYSLQVNKDGYRAFKKEIVVTNNVVNEIMEVTQAPKPILSVINPEAPVIQNVEAVAEQIQLRVQSPENQEATKEVVAPTVATVAVLNVATAVSAFNLFNYLRFFLTQPLLLLGRKKRRKWGMVYNALSKRPVDLAIVRLIKAQTNLVVQTRITDAFGRFAFIVQPGAYRLQVVKPKFVFPTVVMRTENEDVGFLDLYHGEIVTVGEPTTLTPNIPVDPVVKEETPKAVLFKRVLRKIQHATGIVSVVVSIGAVFVVPTLLMAGFAAIQVVMYLLFRRLALPPKPAGWGIVYEQTTNKRLARTVVRIFNKKYNKLLETQVTDESGRYGFVVGKDIFYLVADRPEYERYVSPELDLVNTKDNLIDHKIAMKKKGTGS